jgi:hypothetical protein
MSWEAWGTPPDEGRELCPICDNTQHTPDKCEIAASEEHSRKHYEGAIALLLQEQERKLTNAYAEGRKDERDQCAQLCESYAQSHAKGDDESKAQAWMMLQCAARIRQQL